MSFKSKAQTRARGRSSFPDLTDRKQLKVDDVIKAYPDGITVTAFGLWIKADGSTLYPVIWAEDDKSFLWAGKVLQDILEAWLEDYSGDPEACSKALQEEGGVKIKFRKGKTKNGRDITYVDIV